VGLDNWDPSAILNLPDVGTTNRQTSREAGAQSEGPHKSEVAWLPKPIMQNKCVDLGFRPVSTCHRRDRGVRWLVGPGLFLALALLAAASVHAETAVGLDARGVDPMVALDNRMGLDVRDELGRSVTAAAVTKDLSRARARRVVEGAFTSRLPKAREILPLLELSNFC
jgi:hypothetical protein